MVSERIPRARRHQRRLMVAFRRKGSTKTLNGFTTNVSTSGMFVATGRLLPVGTRVEAEVRYQDQGFVVEAEVIRVLQQPHELRGIRFQGIGLRFLPVADLVRELIGGVEQRQRAVPGEPAPQTEVYRVSFDDPATFLRVYDRDLTTGGLYVLTERAAELGERVAVELLPPGGDAIRFEAKVVHKSESKNADGTRNLLAGIGVELSDRDSVLAALAPAIARCRRQSA